MKKFLLTLIVTMLTCIGAWADPASWGTGNKSSWEVDGTTLTVIFASQADWNGLGWGSEPWASNESGLTTVVLKFTDDFDASTNPTNDNFYHFTQKITTVTTLDLSALSAELLDNDNVKNDLTANKHYSGSGNGQVSTIILPDSYEYDSSQDPWKNYTISGGTDLNTGGSGSGGSGSTPSVVATGHVTYATTLAANDVATINLAAEVCSDGACDHSLATILFKASISTDDAFAKVIIKGAATSDFEAQVVNLNTKALVLADVTGLTVSSTLSNSYVKNLVLPNGLHKNVVTTENLTGFTKLESAASVEGVKEEVTTYTYKKQSDGSDYTGPVNQVGEEFYGEEPEQIVLVRTENGTENSYTLNGNKVVYDGEVTDGVAASISLPAIVTTSFKIAYTYNGEDKEFDLSTAGTANYWFSTQGDRELVWVDGMGGGQDVPYTVKSVTFSYNLNGNNVDETIDDSDVLASLSITQSNKKQLSLTGLTATDVAITSETLYSYSYNDQPYTGSVTEDNGTYYGTKNNPILLTRYEHKDLQPSSNLSLVAYVNKAGTLYATLMHMSALGSTWYSYDTRAMNPYFGTEHGSYGYTLDNVKYVTLAGNLKATDINGGAAVIDPTTHHYVPSGTAGAVSYGAFGFGTKAFVSLDLENAVFDAEYYKDLTISAYGIFADQPTYEQFVKLPNSESMTIIPAGCLQNKRGIKELCIPYNYTVVEADAFKDTGISHIYTTSPLAQDVEGTHYEVGDKLDLGSSCWTLPPFLTKIETGAFWTNVTHGVTDVYIYNPVAPVCQKDAFPKGMYTGWGGFEGNNAHPINRNTYHNGDDLFTILHFPSGLTDAARGKYTDITRKYSFMDETGATDDDGNVFYWPAMNQFYRAYDQAVAGVTWDAWIASHDPNDYTGETGWDPTVTYDDFSAARTGTESKLNTTYGTTYENLSSAVQYDYENYMGWHQFVLVGSMNYKKTTGEEKYWNFSKYKDQDWYTLCVPFDMTKADLLRIFGDPNTERYPKVVTLAGVDRNKNTQHIQIRLSEDLITKKLNVDANGLVEVAKAGTGKYEAQYTDRTGGDTEKIIEANKPYFILPCIPEDQVDIANAGNRALEYKPLEDDKVAQTPYLYHHVNAFNGDRTKFIDWQDKEYDAAPGQPYKYYFVGTYLEQNMPLYAYYLGVKSKQSTVFRNTKTTKLWSSFTTIIGAVASSSASIELGGGGVSDGQATNFRVAFTAEEDFTFNNELPSQVKAGGFTYAFEEGDNTTTGIMIPNIDGSMTFVPSNSKVYNMNGQVVGTSLENLNKGVYIVNGKKFIVK